MFVQPLQDWRMKIRITYWLWIFSHHPTGGIRSQWFPVKCFSCESFSKSDCQKQKWRDPSAASLWAGSPRSSQSMYGSRLTRPSHPQYRPSAWHSTTTSTQNTRTIHKLHNSQKHTQDKTVQMEHTIHKRKYKTLTLKHKMERHNNSNLQCLWAAPCGSLHSQSSSSI